MRETHNAIQTNAIQRKHPDDEMTVIHMALSMPMVWISKAAGACVLSLESCYVTLFLAISLWNCMPSCSLDSSCVSMNNLFKKLFRIPYMLLHQASKTMLITTLHLYTTSSNSLQTSPYSACVLPKSWSIRPAHKQNWMPIHLPWWCVPWIAFSCTAFVDCLNQGGTDRISRRATTHWQAKDEEERQDPVGAGCWIGPEAHNRQFGVAPWEVVFHGMCMSPDRDRKPRWRGTMVCVCSPIMYSLCAVRWLCIGSTASHAHACRRSSFMQVPRSCACKSSAHATSSSSFREP